MLRLRVQKLRKYMNEKKEKKNSTPKSHFLWNHFQFELPILLPCADGLLCACVLCVFFFFCIYCFFATNTTFFDSLRSLFWASLCFLECGLPKFSIAKIYSTYKCTTTIVTTLSTMKLYTNWHPTAAPVKVCVQQLYVIHM